MQNNVKLRVADYIYVLFIYYRLIIIYPGTIDFEFKSENNELTNMRWDFLCHGRLVANSHRKQDMENGLVRYT